MYYQNLFELTQAALSTIHMSEIRKKSGRFGDSIYLNQALSTIHMSEARKRVDKTVPIFAVFVQGCGFTLAYVTFLPSCEAGVT